MEIKNRECEIVEIGKIKYYFISKFNAGDFVKILDTKFIGSLKASKGKVRQVEMTLGEMYKDMIPLIPEFCLLAKDGEKEIEITEEYVMNMEDMDDFNKLIQTTIGVVTKVAGGEKKALRQSKG